METININFKIEAPIQKVFAELTDHSRYSRFKGIDQSQLIKQGDTEKNGLGAVRKLVSSGVVFIEEILQFKPLKSFEYKIKTCHLQVGPVKVKIPLIHQLGRLDFTEKFGQTEVHWVSIIDFNVPFFSKRFSKVFANQGKRGFTSILKHIKRELENKSSV